jgi:hypothetical protein
VTDRAAASSSFSSSISSFTASPPYSATSLKSSTSPVPIHTSAPTGSTSSNQGGNRPGGANAASIVAADIKVILTGTVLAALVGGLALGL